MKILDASTNCSKYRKNINAPARPRPNIIRPLRFTVKFMGASLRVYAEVCIKEMEGRKRCIHITTTIGIHLQCTYVCVYAVNPELFSWDLCGLLKPNEAKNV